MKTAAISELDRGLLIFSQEKNLSAPMPARIAAKIIVPIERKA